MLTQHNILVVLSWIAQLIGWTTMMFGGLYLFAHIADWLFLRTLDRVLRFFDVLREFLAFAMPRIQAREIARRDKRRKAG